MATATSEAITVRSIGDELRRQFGCRVHKVPVHGGMTCPNRDGRLGTGGCIYCGPGGSQAPGSDPSLSVAEQLRIGMDRARRRFGARKFIAYFQPFTNTYAPVEQLAAQWQAAAQQKDIVGLSVGTRPDCLPEDVLELLAGFGETLPYLCLELGLQSVHDRTLKLLRRGHDFAAFQSAVFRARGRGIPLCAHIILGLPGETLEDMLKTVRTLLEMDVEGIKLHHLHVLKDTPLAAAYAKGEMVLMSMTDYIEVVVEILRLVSGRMVIHRLMGEAPREHLVAPEWTTRKQEVVTAIYRRLERPAVVPAAQAPGRSRKGHYAV